MSVKKKGRHRELLHRDLSLDKGYPFSQGYTWAPAVIDDYPLVQFCSNEAADKHITEKEKTIKGMVFYQKTALGKKITYNALRGDLRKVGVAKESIRWPGLDMIKATKFSLYNQADVGPESVRGKIARDLVRKHSYVMQDSGGFQLVSGAEDFVDPLQVARKHTLYADSGVSLDLPVSGINDKAFALVAAKLLQANTKIILSNVCDSVKVMNVCHGATLSIRSAFLDVVTQEPAHSLCIAGLRKAATNHESDFDRSTPYAFTSHVLLAMLRTEKLYEHYHVLGVATPWQMAILSLISHIHGKIVTSDSASHSLSAKSGLLLDYCGEPAYKHQGRSIKSYGKLYCSCPMCYELKDSLWYTVGASWMPAIHNIYSLLRAADTFDHLAKVMIADKASPPQMAKEMLHNIVGLHPKLTHDFQRAVSLITKVSKVSQLKDLPEGGKSLGLFKHQVRSKVPPRFIEIVEKYQKYHNKKWM